MPIKFRCPHCRQFLGISRSEAGRVTDCPTCGELVRVPELNGRATPLPTSGAIALVDEDEDEDRPTPEAPATPPEGQPQVAAVRVAVPVQQAAEQSDPLARLAILAASTSPKDADCRPTETTRRSAFITSSLLLLAGMVTGWMMGRGMPEKEMPDHRPAAEAHPGENTTSPATPTDTVEPDVTEVEAIDVEDPAPATLLPETQNAGEVPGV